MGDASEVRETSETGGQKGSKDRRFDLVPVGPMDDVARLYAFGAKKYAAHNWRKGYDWHLSYAAAQRHLTQFWNGEDVDEETGLPHLAAVVFHSLALMEFAKSYPEGDDRPPPSGTLYVEEPERKQVATMLISELPVLDREALYQAPPGERALMPLPGTGFHNRSGRLLVHSTGINRAVAGTAYYCTRCERELRGGHLKSRRDDSHAAECPLFCEEPGL